MDMLVISHSDRGLRVVKRAGVMAEILMTFNLEAGMPTVEVARQRLLAKIDEARCLRIPLMKIIHGYGSSGVGGTLRTAVRKSLNRRRSEGKISRIIFGERWSIFDPVANEILLTYPAVRRDCDLDRYNQGMTIIELKLD